MASGCEDSAPGLTDGRRDHSQGPKTEGFVRKARLARAHAEAGRELFAHGEVSQPEAHELLESLYARGSNWKSTRGQEMARQRHRNSGGGL